MNPAARLRFQSSSPDDTARLAQGLAALLEAGDVLLLSGELGAGKTTLVRELAVALGTTIPASSPTYVLAQVYPIEDPWVLLASPDSTELVQADPDGRRARALVHLDAYRLDCDADLGLIGWDRLFEPDSIAVIEWPARLEDHPQARPVLDAPTTGSLDLVHTGATSRRFTLELPESWRDRDGFVDLLALAAELDRDQAAGQARSDAAGTPPREDTTCPITGARVPADSPTWPFSSERAKLADLYRWMTEGYTISRPIEERDLDEE